MAHFDPFHRLQRQMEAIQRITGALYSANTLEEKEERVRQVAMEVVDARAGTVYLHDPQRRMLIFHHVVASEEVRTRMQGMLMPDDQGIAGSVFQSGISRIAHGMLTVPLKSMQGSSIGVLQVLERREGQFDEADREVLEILAAHTASVFEMGRLYEVSRRASIIHLIGDISHDIKNFLTPVVTGSQTLEMEIQATLVALEEAAAGMPTSYRQQVGRAVEGLQSFYVEATTMVCDGAHDAQERVREIADAIKGVISEPNFEEVHFQDVAQAVTRVLTLDAARRGLTLDRSGVEDTGPVELDRKAIYNALYNLVSNAIHETSAGGTISIRARLAEFRGLPGLQVEVADSGKGIPGHVRDRLFTEHAISTKPGGTGLGTRIVKNVVDLHGGMISVESQPGQGTTFTLCLPVRQEHRTGRGRATGAPGLYTAADGREPGG